MQRFSRTESLPCSFSSSSSLDALELAALFLDEALVEPDFLLDDDDDEEEPLEELLLEDDDDDASSSGSSTMGFLRYASMTTSYALLCFLSVSFIRFNARP